MEIQNGTFLYFDHLRREIDGLTNINPSKEGAEHSKAKIQEILVELEATMSELETQNKEHIVYKEQSDKYLELYDFSSVGYFTLSKSDTIIDLNL